MRFGIRCMFTQSSHLQIIVRYTATLEYMYPESYSVLRREHNLIGFPEPNFVSKTVNILGPSQSLQGKQFLWSVEMVAPIWKYHAGIWHII